LPHLGPTGSSSGQPPSITARYFSSYPSDSTSRWTPCPPEYCKERLQVHLGCIQLSPSCPFRLLHTSSSLRPARHYSRLWIQRPSSGRRRDFNPLEQRAASAHYAAVRFLGDVHAGRTALAFSRRPAAWFAAGVSEVSRFSCMKFLGVPGVYDYAGLTRGSRYRPCSCCLPHISTASAS